MFSVRRKITIEGKDWGYYEVIDFTEPYLDKFGRVSKKHAEDYFRVGEFLAPEIKGLNGNSFVFGYIEALMQSDDCPYRARKGPILRVIVEEVK